VWHPLDNPVLASLSGPHQRFVERRGNVARYPVDVTPFLAMPGEPTAADWADAVALVGPGNLLSLAGAPATPPDAWERIRDLHGVQLTGEGLAVASDPEAVQLGPGDVPEMLELVSRTQPGPFLARTVEMGRYLGIRRDGRLVAMAGERMRPQGWTEISAVCTDEEWRGQGLSTRLIRAVGAGIRTRGDVPFLHALATNPAVKLYEKLGFRHRAAVRFVTARVPERQSLRLRCRGARGRGR
jgi:GNAT superfamily N-acetyltransferase